MFLGVLDSQQIEPARPNPKTHCKSQKKKVKHKRSKKKGPKKKVKKKRSIKKVKKKGQK